MQHKKVVVGVSGGIAAYKACALVSQLVQAGAEVRVIMTEHATEFVQPLTFQALSRNEVYTNTFIENNPEKIAHIDVADWADLFVLAPATANLIAKIAHGLADDMLTTTLLATEAPVYISPAMNVHMYQHVTVKENLSILASRGYHFIEPKAGYLACGYVGKGRLEEPTEIIQVLTDHFHKPQILQGKKVLISAGPTREILDPVRFFSNRSSGKMGFAFAEAAAAMGADVTLVAGPVALLDPTDKNINTVHITSTEEMYQAMHQFYPKSDLVIKAAAVSDYRPVLTHEHKIKKQTGNLMIEFERTEDILRSLGQEKKNQFLVGFAAETESALVHGKKKLFEKNLDGIIVNDILAAGAGFEGDTNLVTYLNKNDEEFALPLDQKTNLAFTLLTRIANEMKGDKSEDC